MNPNFRIVNANNADIRPGVASDWITGNGGDVNSALLELGSESGKTFGIQHMSDIWDLNPFKQYSSYITDIEGPIKHLPKSIKNAIANFEIGPILKGKPFRLEMDVPYTIDSRYSSMFPDAYYGFKNEE